MRGKMAKLSVSLTLAFVMTFMSVFAYAEEIKPQEDKVIITEDDLSEDDTLDEVSEEIIDEVDIEESTVSGDTISNEGDGYGLSNPRKSEDGVVTWDCVYFGSYPQAEVVADKSKYTAIGSNYLSTGDIIESSGLYNTLQSAIFNNKNLATVNYSGSTYTYKRIKQSDVTLSRSDEPYSYKWSDTSTWHYFRCEPIKWRVLSVDGSDAFLLADKGLDDQRYNASDSSITWEKSTIRSWLNGYGSTVNTCGTDYSSNNFMDTAFASSEKAVVKTTSVVNANNTGSGTEGGKDTEDKVFLLSESEVYRTSNGFSSFYNSGDKCRRSRSSTYAKAMGAPFCASNVDYRGNCYWWLRSPGKDATLAADVTDDGYVNRNGSYVCNIAYSRSGAVRPALHIDLSYNLHTSAGTINSDGVVTGGDIPASVSDCLESVTYKYGSKEVDVLTNAHQIEYSHSEFDLICKEKDTSNITGYSLCADSSVIRESKNGNFTKVSPNGLQGKELSIVTTSSDGSTKKTPIFLSVIVPGTVKIPKFSIGDGISVKLDDDFPLIGGSSAGFEFPELPVNVELEDGKIRIGVNIAQKTLKSWDSKKGDTTATSRADEKKSYKEKWEDWAKEFKSDKETTAKLLKSDLKDIQSVCQKNDIPVGMPGIKGKVKWNLVGYFEGTWSDDCVYENAEGGIIVTCEASEKWNKQYMIWYIPATIMVSGKVSGELSGKAGYNFPQQKWYGDVTFSGEAKLEPYAGIGVADYASVGVYGQVKLGTEIIIISSEEKGGLKEVTMYGEAGAKAYFAKMEVAKIQLWDTGDLKKSKTYGKYVSKNKLLLYSRDAASLIGDLLPEKKSSSYAADTVADSAFNLPHTDTKWHDYQGAEILSEGKDGEICMAKIYGGAMPVISKDGFVAYLSESENNTTLSYGFPADGMKTVYAVDGDGTSDFGHRLYSDEDGTYLIYQDSRKKYDTSAALQAEDYLGSFGISVAQYDKSTKKFVDLGSPDTNDVFCYGHVLTRSSEGLTALWAENKSSSPMQEDSKNRILYSEYKSGNWSSPVVLADNIGQVSNLAACTDGIDTYVAYSLEENGKSTIYLSKNYGSAVASKMEGVVCNMISTAVPGHSGNVFAFNMNGGLYSLVPADMSQSEILAAGTMDTGASFDIDGNGVYYCRTDDEKRGIYAALYDDSTKSYGQTEIVNDEGYIDAFDICNGEMTYIITDVTMLETEGTSEFDIKTSSKLVCTEVPSRSEISIDGYDLNHRDMLTDDPVPVTLYISNTGTEKINECKTSYTVNGNNVTLPIENSSLLPGETKELTVNIEFPSDPSELELPICVVGDGKAEKQMTIDATKTELVVESQYCVTAEDPYCEVTVKNESLVPATATLAVTNRDGTELLSKEISLEAQESTSVQVSVSELIAEGDSDILCAEVSTEAEEYYYDNNTVKQRIWKVDTSRTETEINESEIDKEVLNYTVTLNKKELSLETGKQESITATVVSGDEKTVEDAEISWVSNDSSVATVENGTITAVSGGEAEIVAGYLGRTAVCKVTVIEKSADPENPDNPVDPENPENPEDPEKTDTTIAVRQKIILSPADFGTTETIAKYVLSSKKLASISSRGVLKAKRAGDVTVTAYRKTGKGKYEAVGEPLTIHIQKPVLTKKTLNKVGETVNANSEILSGTTLTPISWTSSKPTVATVDEKTGVITAVKSGTAKITAYFGEGTNAAKYTTKVTVKIPRLSSSKATLKAGKTKKLKIKNTNLPVSEWKSSDEAVATVDENGLVIAVSAGNAVISATVDGVDYGCTVTVNSLPYDKYLVWFDANGGKVKSLNKIVTFGYPYGKLPKPTKPGARFLGWYTQKEGGEEIKASDDFENSRDVTLYARWE